MGDKKRVGVVVGWRGGGEEMESYMELRGGNERWWWWWWCVWGGAEDKRKSRGENEKAVGSGDELKHPVPG